MKTPEFGAELVRFREAADLSQSALARGAGLTSMFIYDMERGRRLPSPEVMLKLAAVLGIKSAELLRFHPEECVRGIAAVARKRPQIAYVLSRLARRLAAGEVSLADLEVLAGDGKGGAIHG